MDFLYPKFFTPTHKIKSKPRRVYVSDPKSVDYKDYNLPYGILLSVVMENVGPKQEWHYVKIVDPKSLSELYYNKFVYIEKKYLKIVDDKKEYGPGSRSTIADSKAEEVNIQKKLVFDPFVDKKNGLLSVRVSTDYDKIIDNYLFDAVLEEAANEGAQILLESKGIRADNQTLQELKNKYHPFIYIHNDLDITTRRACESLIFTVSVPLSFIEEVSASHTKQEEETVWTGGPILQFTNRDIRTKIDKITKILESRSDDIADLLYPNKFIENFTLLFEIASLKTFLQAASSAFESFGLPFDSQTVIQYQLYLSNDLELIKSSAIYEGNLQKLSKAQVSKLRLTGEFNNKRIFNYLLNLDAMYFDSDSMKIYDFLLKYVKYPDIALTDSTLQAGNQKISGEQATQFVLGTEQLEESCLNFGDLKDTYSIITDPLFHVWRTQEKSKQEDTGLEDFIRELGNSLDVAKNSAKEKSREVEKDKKDLETYAAEIKIKQKEGNSVRINQIGEEVKKIRQKLSKDKIELTSAEEIQNEIQKQYDKLEKIKKQQDGFTINFDTERTQNFNFSEEVLNVNTLMYVMNRANLGKLLLQKMVCWIRGINGSEIPPEVQTFIESLPNDIFYYFRYWETLNKKTGIELADMLANNLPVNIKIFCSTNASAIYWTRGIIKLSKTLLDVIKNLGPTLDTLKPYVGKDKNSRKEWYTVFADAAYEAGKQALLDATVQLIKSSLYEDCDSEQQLTNYNFANPLNTHSPISISAGSGQINNEPELLKQNRKEAIKYILPASETEVRRLYGVDTSYFIDLIGRLIDDVSCLLTPQETIDLLKNVGSDVVITTIRNLIRTKYSSPNNDLTYLLDDPNKIKLLFQKLGLTIDKQLVSRIELAIKNTVDGGLPPDDPVACREGEPDRPLDVQKVPEELGVLNNRRARRIKRTKELIDRIQNAGSASGKELTYLCDESTTQEIENAKVDLLKKYSNYIDRIFESVDASFSREAYELKSEVLEDKVAIRGKFAFGSSEDFAGGVNWNSYHQKLGSSINYGACNASIENPVENINTEVNETPIEKFNGNNGPSLHTYFNYLYYPDIQIDYEQMAQTILAPNQNVEGVNLICKGVVENDADEFVSEEKSSTRIWVSKVWTSDSLWDADEIDDLYDRKTGTAYALRNIKPNYFIGIELDYDATWGDSNMIKFNMIYRDDFTKKFRILETVEFQGDSEDIAGDLKLSSDDFYNNFDDNLEDENVYDNRSSSFLIFLDTVAGSDEYAINKKIWNNLDWKVRDLIRAIYINKFKKYVSRIENYETQANNYRRIKKFGIFHYQTEFHKEDNDFLTIKKNINVSNMKKIDDRNETVYENFINFDTGVGALPGYNQLFTKYLIPNIYRILLKNNKYIKFTYDVRKDFDYFEETTSDMLMEIFTLGLTGEKLTQYTPERDEYFRDFHNETGAKLGDVKVTSHIGSDKEYNDAYSLLALLSKSATLEQKRCNISTSYLNIPFFKDRSLNVLLNDMCNIEYPEFNYNSVLVNIIYRVFVADIMVKAVPYLHKLTREEYIGLDKEFYTFQIVKEFMLKELSVYNSPNAKSNVPYNVLERLTKQLYSKYESENSLVAEFIHEESKTKEVDYFIHREIKYFLSYTESRNMIIHSDERMIDDFFDDYSERTAPLEGNDDETIVPYLEYYYLNIREHADRYNDEKADDRWIVKGGFYVEEEDNTALIWGIVIGVVVVAAIVVVTVASGGTALAGAGVVGASATTTAAAGGVGGAISGTAAAAGASAAATTGAASAAAASTAAAANLTAATTAAAATTSAAAVTTSAFGGLATAAGAAWSAQLALMTANVAATITAAAATAAGAAVASTGVALSSAVVLGIAVNAGVAIAGAFIGYYGTQYAFWAARYNPYDEDDRKKSSSISPYIGGKQFFNEYVQTELNYSMAYVIMCSTIDPKLRTIFAETKAELMQLLLTSDNVNKDDAEEANQLDAQEYNQKDLQNFLDKLPYAHSPASLILIYPSYSKYIKFFLKQTFAAARNQFLNDAKQNDPNIIFTRLVNDGMSLIGSAGWAVTPQKMRENMLWSSNGAESMFLNRINDGRSISPDLITSIALNWTVGWPGRSGLIYLGLDSIYEATWYAEWHEKWLKERPKDIEPCQPINKDNEDTKCNPIKKEEEQAKVNKEEPEVSMGGYVPVSVTPRTIPPILPIVPPVRPPYVPPRTPPITGPIGPGEPPHIPPKAPPVVPGLPPKVPPTVPVKPPRPPEPQPPQKPEIPRRVPTVDPKPDLISDPRDLLKPKLIIVEKKA
jgi:hypothetical protein